MARKEQDCTKCEYKDMAEEGCFCYMFKEKVKYCGQFKPLLKDGERWVRGMAIKVAKKYKAFMQ